MKNLWFRKGFLLSLTFLLLLAGISCKQPENNKDNRKDIKIESFKIKGELVEVSKLQDSKIELPFRIESFTKNDIREIKGKDGSEDVFLALDKITPDLVTPTKEGVAFTITTKATKKYKASTLSNLLAVKKDAVKYKITYSVDPQVEGSISPTIGGTPLPADGMVEECSVITFMLTITDPKKYKLSEWQGAEQDASNPLKATLTVDGSKDVVAKLKKRGGGGDNHVMIKFGVKGDEGNLKLIIGKYTYLHTGEGAHYGVSVPKGTEISFVAEPEGGRLVEAWEGVSGQKEQKEVKVQPQNDLDVKVTFKRYYFNKHKVSWELKPDEATGVDVEVMVDGNKITNDSEHLGYTKVSFAVKNIPTTTHLKYPEWATTSGVIEVNEKDRTKAILKTENADAKVTISLRKIPINLKLSSIEIKGVKIEGDGPYVFALPSDAGDSLQTSDVTVVFENSINPAPQVKFEEAVPFTIDNTRKIITLKVEAKDNPRYNDWSKEITVYKLKKLKLTSITVNDNIALEVEGGAIKADQAINAEKISKAEAQFEGISGKVPVVITGTTDLTAEGVDVTFSVEKDGYEKWTQTVKIKKS